MSAFFVYRSNDGNLYAPDSAPASLFAFNVLEHGTLVFDDFRGSYLGTSASKYIFTEAPSGHLASIFPMGTAFLTAPIYVCDYVAARARGDLSEITSIAFEPTRLAYEKQASVLVASLAAVLFFLCAAGFTSRLVALFLTVAFAFGSDMWTVGSQALWQHGSVVLVTTALLLALLANLRAPNAVTLSIAGICAGFLPVIRPTAIAFSLAALAFVAISSRRRSFPFFAGALLGLMPGIVWNALVFHSALGGYAIIQNSYTFSVDEGIAGVEGLLFSPNRGLFVFTPWIVFSLAGAIVCARTNTPKARMLSLFCIAAIVTFVNYAFFQRWEGGSTFGPRYLTDIVPVAALCLTFVVPRSLRGLHRRAAAASTLASILILYSVAVQTVGSTGEPKTNWSGIPLDVGLDHERLWAWQDSQIERDARAAFALWTDNPTFSQAYATGFDGQIASLATSPGGAQTLTNVNARANGSVYLRAVLRNSGTTRWYGYPSGLYFGQARVRVRYFDRQGSDVHEDYLYVKGSPEPRERTEAIGRVTVPATPGTYTAIFDLDVFQNPRIGARHVGAISIPAVVAP